MNCSIARSLEVIGEWWTLLIVRDAFFGITRFEEFQARLGIARNILTKRLDTLVDGGVWSAAATTNRGHATTTCSPRRVVTYGRSS
jgi:DNA-binding HxlR family transcriptional regulator